MDLFLYDNGLLHERVETNVLNDSQYCQNIMALFSRIGSIRNMERKNIDFSKIW